MKLMGLIVDVPIVEVLKPVLSHPPCCSVKWDHENCCWELGGVIRSIPFLMGFANGVWEFIIRLVKTEHVTSHKSSDNIREKCVATQKERRVGCVKPGPVYFCSQCLLPGLGRHCHLIFISFF